MEEISLIINARVNSSRVYHKLIRNFANTTLLDICLRKISKIKKYPCYLGANEDEILSIYDNYKNSIRLLLRDKKSVKKGTKDEVVMFSHYKNIPTKYIMWINPCCPFTSNELYMSAIKTFFEEKYKTMTSVKIRDNIFFNNQLQVINASKGIVTSNNNKTLYEMAHVFHIFDKEFFLDRGHFWNYTEKNPHLFVVDEPQFFDIDTELEFFLYEKLYVSQQLN